MIRVANRTYSTRPFDISSIADIYEHGVLEPYDYLLVLRENGIINLSECIEDYHSIIFPHVRKMLHLCIRLLRVNDVFQLVSDTYSVPAGVYCVISRDIKNMPPRHVNLNIINVETESKFVLSLGGIQITTIMQCTLIKDLPMIIQEAINVIKPNYISPVMKRVYSSRYTEGETNFKFKNKYDVIEPAHFHIVKSLSPTISLLQSIRFQCQSTVIIDISATELKMLVYLLYHGTLFEYSDIITRDMLNNILKAVDYLCADEIIEYIIKILSLLPIDEESSVDI